VAKTLVGMSATFALPDLGTLVDVSEIERELKKLWQQGEQTKTRASHINLAIYSEEPDSLSRNTEIVSKITENSACRAIVIRANRSAKENRVEAWINAHCHLARAGSKQVCSEQLSFSLEGPCVRLLPSIVFSHLDSDLPFYLWWQGEFCDPMDSQLSGWVDRLIYDSQTWRDVDTQMRLLKKLHAETEERVILCDLNWTRLVHLRFALAQFFDHPASHHHFAKIARVEIDFASGYRSTAVLLAGWIAAQLQWRRTDQSLNFRTPTDEKAEIVLHEKAGEPISRCLLARQGREFRVVHPTGTDLLEVSLGSPGKTSMRQLMPGAKNDPSDLVNEELNRGGPRRVYLRALQCVRDLL
jgi:glucose-6-phosphate dehydrogenase assembly protein OpcA